MNEKIISRRQFIKTSVLAASAVAFNWTGLAQAARAIPNKKDIRVVIIGAGLGGLISGAYLAKYGFNVTLMEQHDIPGGYATSFDRGDFTFDVSLHATVAEHGWPQKILSDIGIWKDLEIVYQPEFKRIVSRDYDIRLPARDPKGVIEVLTGQFPHEKRGIRTFYTQMVEVISAIRQGKESSSKIMDQLDAMTLEQWISLHISDPEVKRVLANRSGYYGRDPDSINALFYAVATGEYLVYGGQYYKDRSQSLSDKLADFIIKNRGQILYQTEVKKIITDSNQEITGVLDIAGQHYPANAVIANCSVPALFNNILDKNRIPESFASQVKKRKSSVSTFCIWLGLNQQPSGSKDYITSLLGKTTKEEFLQTSHDDPTLTNLEVVQCDNLFHTYSPKGKATVSIVAHSNYEYWKKFESDYFSNEKIEYNREKQRIAEIIIKRVEHKIIPGLSGMIEEMEVGTPLTNIYYTHNPQGAIYGFDRSQPSLGSKTPISGLFLASAWSHGGGFTPVMRAGMEAAHLLMRQFQS